MNTWHEDEGVRRDLSKARVHRDKPRYARDAGKMAKDWLQGPEARRIKKMQKVNSVIQDIFPEQVFTRLSAQSLNKGSLIIIVSDSVLMSEMKNHHHHRFLEALIHAGTGVTSIKYRLKKNN